MTIGTIANGHSQCVIGSSCQTATRNTASEPAAKTTTCRRLSSPAGISREAVRGLRASIPASISRFAAIANERAPAIATVIQSIPRRPGQPPTARIAPT